MLLLFIRVIVAPAWVAAHIREARNPETTFEQVRLHKRRSSFLDDAAAVAVLINESEVHQLRIILRLVAVLIAGMCIALAAPLFPGQPTPFSCPLFLRHRVLRL